MNIRKFIADSTQAALKMVKEEMGPEAVILRTRTLSHGRNGKPRPSERIELTAAVDFDAISESEGCAAVPDIPGAARSLENLEADLREIKHFLWSSNAGAVLKPEIYFNRTLMNRYLTFKKFGLDSESMTKLMLQAEPGEYDTKISARQQLRECLISVLDNIHFEKDEEKQRSKKIYSFIGPTGVGKTTTLAKLAALKALKQRNKVALITIDTFRIAAVAQLEAYARIMGLPLQVATNRAELQTAIKKHEDRDIILIDTAGKSPNNHREIKEISEVFQVGEKIHHFLVLSAATQYQNLVNAEKRFGVLPFESYIFTKLDEVDDASSVVNFLISRSKPVSYFTTGQQVPEDMEPASKKKLAAMILGRKQAVAANSVYEVN